MYIDERLKEFATQEKYNAQETAFLINVSVKTLTQWYEFARLKPDHELAKMLPKYEQKNRRSARYWNREDIEKLKAFQEAIPRGSKGEMGCITQRYREDKKA